MLRSFLNQINIFHSSFFCRVWEKKLTYNPRRYEKVITSHFSRRIVFFSVSYGCKEKSRHRDGERDTEKRRVVKKSKWRSKILNKKTLFFLETRGNKNISINILYMH